MFPKITYSDLSSLFQIQKTIESLDSYMTIIREMMSYKYPQYEGLLDFDIKNHKYIYKQVGWSYDIETGFWWEVDDLYFGIKIIVPQGTDDLNRVHYNQSWSYGIDGYNDSYYQLFRFADEMIIGNTELEYFEILDKFKLLCLRSEEVVNMVEKITSRN